MVTLSANVTAINAVRSLLLAKASTNSLQHFDQILAELGIDDLALFFSSPHFHALILVNYSTFVLNLLLFTLNGFKPTLDVTVD